jgi:hypothetical protein
MQSLGIVDFVDEPRQPLGDIGEGLIAGEIDLFDFEG